MTLLAALIAWIVAATLGALLFGRFARVGSGE